LRIGMKKPSPRICVVCAIKACRSTASWATAWPAKPRSATYPRIRPPCSTIAAVPLATAARSWWSRSNPSTSWLRRLHSATSRALAGRTVASEAVGVWVGDLGAHEGDSKFERRLFGWNVVGTRDRRVCLEAGATAGFGVVGTDRSHRHCWRAGGITLCDGHGATSRADACWPSSGASERAQWSQRGSSCSSTQRHVVRTATSCTDRSAMRCSQAGSDLERDYQPAAGLRPISAWPARPSWTRTTSWPPRGIWRAATARGPSSPRCCQTICCVSAARLRLGRVPLSGSIAACRRVARCWPRAS
jgi:hypothetical protein